MTFKRQRSLVSLLARCKRVRLWFPIAALNTLTGCHSPLPTDGSAATSGDVSIGRPAPDFDLPSIVGSTSLTLSELKGHVVVLDFWAVWCEPCQKSLRAAQALHQRHSDVTIIGIAVDDDQTGMQQIARQLGITFPMLWDPKGATGPYRVSALPTTYVLDRQSIVRYEHIGVRNDAAIETEVTGLLAR